jgi:hypothetical protein
MFIIVTRQRRNDVARTASRARSSFLQLYYETVSSKTVKKKQTDRVNCSVTIDCLSRVEKIKQLSIFTILSRVDCNEGKEMCTDFKSHFQDFKA